MENQFTLYKDYKNNLTATNFASVTVKNISIPSDELDDLIEKIVLEDKNLKCMFDCKNLTLEMRKKLYRRFIPTAVNFENIDKFVEESTKRRSFYSFLAEGIMALVLRDIVKCCPAAAVIDFNTNTSGSKTGVDGCFYDKTSSKFILGEAKFYKDFKSGMMAAIECFIGERGIFNKLDDYYVKIKNNHIANQIVLRELDKETAFEYTIEDFLKLNHIFCGFVLHENGSRTQNDYDDTQKLYDCFNVSLNETIENIVSSIEDKVKISKSDIKCSLYFFHLPIKSKVELISKVILLANKKLCEIYGKHI